MTASNPTRRIFALVPAAGVGARMQAACPKQYLEVAPGVTMLAATVEALARVEAIGRIYVAVSPEDGYVDGIDLPERARVLRTGGSTRALTVANTLAALACEMADDDLVLVHDAARPLLHAADVRTLIETVIRAQEAGTAAGAVLAMPVHDTVKRVDHSGVLTEDLDREGLVRIATPQCFAYGLLKKALAAAGPAVTDESGAVRAIGGKVLAVPCSPETFKVTRNTDLALARKLLAAGTPSPAQSTQPTMNAVNPPMVPPMLPELRIGLGYDSHRLAAGRKFILGGVDIPHTLGLDGHSDADALLHAVTDAILGAAHCGNIGILFPDNDPAYRGADSTALLAAAWDKVQATGPWAVINLDCVVVAQKPKLNPHVEAMAQRIAAILGTDPARISIKPKTNEKLGFEGREEGISVQAAVLLGKLR